MVKGLRKGDKVNGREGTPGGGEGGGDIRPGNDVLGCCRIWGLLVHRA